MDLSHVFLSKIRRNKTLLTLQSYPRLRASGKPEFYWWVPYMLRKQYFIISSINPRLRITMHNYEIEIPMNVDHSYGINKKNKDKFWQDTIYKEMQNFGIFLRS